jgi:glycyl-tRNA synthetase beta chain
LPGLDPGIHVFVGMRPNPENKTWMAGSSPAKAKEKNRGAPAVTGELLLELLSEEIPARMQRRAIEDLVGLVRDKLAAADIPAAKIEGHVTPRRLVVIADGIPARQPDREDERRGPRVGAPEAAIGGFLRAAGLVSIDQCERRATDRGEFYFAVLRRSGAPTGLVLLTLLREALAELPWPKSMRYPASDLRWVRPINSMICLFDGSIIQVPIGDMPVGTKTRGHRFLSPGEFAVENAADYRAKLAAAHVVLDRAARRAIIECGLAKVAAAEGLTVKPDEGLLEEVTGLVEYPVVLMGSIDADFVRPLPEGLPPEVLATAMRTHQKYFTCLNPDGSPAPRFLFVANNVTPDGGKTIAAGNERVLRARLSDARFFWDQDRKIRLEDRVEALKQRVYHEKLRSVYDKVERMEKLAVYLADQLASQLVTPAKAGVQEPSSERLPLDSRLRGNDDGEDFKARCVRAARLAKADLSTGMVGEFPELQGVVGRYYALSDGEDPRTADAVAGHYKPLGPNDSCPTSPESIVVALADKIDALVGFYGIDETPTGSRDPFALRRAALGIARLIFENNFHLNLRQVLEFSHGRFQSGLLNANAMYVSYNVLTFIVDRLKIYLRDHGVRSDLIAATVYKGPLDYDDDLVRILARQAALAEFLSSDDGANLLTAYRRASNIVRIEETRDQAAYKENEYQALLGRPLAEEALVHELNQAETLISQLIENEQFVAAMAELAKLRKPVDEFFDKVTVNVDDKQLRENRLRLLARIRATMNQIADFSQIEG